MTVMVESKKVYVGLEQELRAHIPTNTRQRELTGNGMRF